MAGQWVWMWKKLWSSLTFHRDWVLIWRILNHGFYHNRRGLIWGMSDSLCPYCHSHTESIEHLFFECCYVRRRWAGIVVWLMGSWLAPTSMKGSLGKILYSGIKRAQRNPVTLVIIVEMLASICRERNLVAYRGCVHKFR